MSRFHADDAGRVLEDATGEVLGHVDTLTLRDTGDSIYMPRDQDGVALGATTMVRDLAVLRVVRTALPGERVTLWDLL